MDDEKRGLIPEPGEVDRVLRAIETAAPILGPIVSSATQGFFTLRRVRRLEEIVRIFEDEFLDLEDEIVREYMRTEEFEDLTIDVLERATRERDEEKRRLFANLLAGLASAPDDAYDVKIRAIRTLESLRPIHIEAIRAVIMPPPTPAQSDFSRVEILGNRIGIADRATLTEIVEGLEDVRVFNRDVSWAGANSEAARVDLRSALTPFGQEFVRFLRETP